MKPYRSDVENAVLSRQSHLTGMHMCELVSDYMLATAGEAATAEQIYRSSPTGDLFHVYQLAWTARTHFTGDVMSGADLRGDITWDVNHPSMDDMIAHLRLLQDALDDALAARAEGHGDTEGSLLSDAVCDITTAIISLKKLQRLRSSDTTLVDDNVDV
jgi:hypothetical protein